MSIGFAGLHVLLPTLLELSKNTHARILVLGTMDLLFTQSELENFLTKQGINFSPIPPNKGRKTNSFATVSQDAWWKYREYVHQDVLFSMLGFNLDQIHALDVDDYEHSDIIHDLNNPIPSEIEPFDLVLDLGTMEHVFNVPQVLWNLSDLCKIGGHVFHMSPVNFLDHGFYNFSAILFEDYYDQAGWVREELFYALFPALAGETSLYARLDKGKLPVVPDGFYINVVAKHQKQSTSTKPIVAQKLFAGLYQAWDIYSRDDAPMGPPTSVKTVSWRERLEALRLQIQRKIMVQRLTKMGGKIYDLK